MQETDNSPMATRKANSAEDAYKQWWIDKTPDKLHKVVKALDGTISWKLQAMGAADNPQLRHQARLFAADAVRKFDPTSGASLQTWTQSNLQSMNRFRRENQGPVKISDRTVIDAWTLEKASREHEDEHGIEPDVHTLADSTGLSVKRIAHVRKATRPVAAASQMFEESQTPVDFMGEAMEYVYGGADTIDRKIIEMTTGYGGSPTMPKNQIAAKLGISPSQVTRRSDRIGQMVQQMDADINQTHA